MIIKKEDYLAHYGILGMKWRQRKTNRILLKARNSGVSINEWPQTSIFSKKSKRLKSEAYLPSDNRDAKKYEIKAKKIINSIKKKQKAKAIYKKLIKQSIK